MPRKNKRLPIDTYLEPIKEEQDYRRMPVCPRFPDKTTFSTGYLAQVSIDEIKARTSANTRRPERVYECKISEGGCGMFHTTGEREYIEKR